MLGGKICGAKAKREGDNSQNTRSEYLGNEERIPQQ